MEFKTAGNRVEIEPQRDGSTFVHKDMTLHMGDELWLEIDGRKHKVTATKMGDVWWIHILGHTLQFEMVEPGATGADNDSGLTAPMPGKILDVLVSEGQSVSSGDALMIMEAMKMEHKIVSGQDGVIESIYFDTGDQVEQGAVLLSIK
jgi:3-methylcrotonyl-CoA carboxylase alpha subunit